MLCSLCKRASTELHPTLSPARITRIMLIEPLTHHNFLKLGYCAHRSFVLAERHPRSCGQRVVRVYIIVFRGGYASIPLVCYPILSDTYERTTLSEHLSYVTIILIIPFYATWPPSPLRLCLGGHRSPCLNKMM